MGSYEYTRTRTYRRDSTLASRGVRNSEGISACKTCTEKNDEESPRTSTFPAERLTNDLSCILHLEIRTPSKALWRLVKQRYPYSA
jgi:hypothetical protein